MTPTLIGSTANPVANLPEFLATPLGQEYARLAAPNPSTLQLARVRAYTEQSVIPLRRKTANPDILQMPARGTRLNVVGSIPLPANGTNNAVVLKYKVPVGHWGYVNFITNQYAGQGFREGSGDLTWAISFGASPVGGTGYPYYQYGSIQTSLGSLTNPQWAAGGGLPLIENQWILYVVSVAAGAQVVPGNNVICSFLGWIAPL